MVKLGTLVWIYWLIVGIVFSFLANTTLVTAKVQPGIIFSSVFAFQLGCGAFGLYLEDKINA